MANFKFAQGQTVGFVVPNANGSASGTNLNAAANRVAHSFYCPNAKTLSAVEFGVLSITGSPLAADVKVEIYSSVAGVPSSSLASVTGATGNPVANTWCRVEGFSLALDACTQYWVVISNLNATPASNAFNVRQLDAASVPSITMTTDSSYMGWHKRQSSDSGSTWASSAVIGAAVLYVEFSDGTHHHCPWESIARVASSNFVYGTRELGAKFTIPSDWPTLKVRGAFFYPDITGAVTSGMTYKLYVGSTPVLQGTTSVAGLNQMPNANMSIPIFFSSPISLAPGDVVRLTMCQETNTGSASVAYRHFEYLIRNTADAKASQPFRGTMMKTYHDGASWTDTDTNIIPCGLILDTDDEFDFSAGSGTSYSYGYM
jgi:hypothetical protein